jgi:protein-tyrosine phosphatase
MDAPLVDFHAHVLPRADHGSDSLDTTITQLKYAKDNGVKLIVATLHFYPDKHSVEKFIELRDLAYKHLSDSTDEQISIIPGAEVLICDGIERLDKIERLCISGTRVLLLELPFSVYKSEYLNSTLRLMKRGFTVVLAHVDRYDPKDIEAFADAGVPMQLNASSLCSFRIPSHIRSWLDAGLVVALGSDIHGKDKKAYKRFAKARKKLEKLGFDKQMTAFSSQLFKS